MSMSDKSSMMGKWMTTALAISGIIGVGIYMLPRSLAPLGQSAPYAWLISAIGIIALGFAASKLITPEGGGMQAYVGSRLGETAGFIVTWSCWVGFCVSDAALAVAAVSFLSFVFPPLGNPTAAPIIAIAMLSGLTLINISGVRNAGGFAIVTVAIRILPLLAVAVLGVILPAASRAAATVGAAPLSISNLAAGTSLTLFALMGFENALTPVGKIRDPLRTIPLAIISATIFTALLYFAATQSLATILGVPAIEQSASPFAAALGSHWGVGASTIATLAIAVSAFGCMSGGVLGVGEMLYSMALRGEVPARFAKVSKRHVPVNALIAGNSLSALLILLNSSKATVALFTFLAALAGDSALVLYTFAALAALKASNGIVTRIAVVIGFAFALFAFYGSGLESTLLVVLLAVAGLVMRALMRRGLPTPAVVETPA